MNETIAIAAVRKSIRVKAPIDRAFDVFTNGLARWWPLNQGVGEKLIATVLMEPRLGGRWLEVSEAGTETTVATITRWEPPPERRQRSLGAPIAIEDPHRRPA